MWPTSHINILITALAILNAFGPFAYSLPIYWNNNELSVPSNDQSINNLLNSPQNFGRAIRMLAEDAVDDANKDEVKGAEKPDEDKQEEVDEDLKSDEVKDDDEDNDDQNDNENDKKGNILNVVQKY